MIRSSAKLSLRKSHWLAAAVLPAIVLVAPAPAQEVDINNRIIDEGMNQSEVMVTAHELLDGIGSRLTNSPNTRKAEDWAVAKFRDYGLSNVRKEGFLFGRGWSMEASSVTMIAPRPLPLTSIPIAWTPGTNGELRAEVVLAPISEEADFDKWRGKLNGKIVMLSVPGTGDEQDTPQFRRLTGEDFGRLDQFRQPFHDPNAEDRRIKRVTFTEKLDSFLAEEGAVAWARRARRDGKLVHGEGYTYLAGRSPKLPGVEIAAEDYRRIARLAIAAETKGTAPTLAINSNTRFHDDDLNAYNIIAEIPGTDPKAGYVMAGAHFDSWHGGDGAVDNGAGSVTVMEAARILKKLGQRPKRTIRFVLWAAEEQGLLGSLAYTERYLAYRPAADPNAPSPTFGWSNRYPINKRPGYYDLKAYFNMDNGSGKLRGIYAEGNDAAVPLLRKWLSPFAQMDAGRVVAGPTGGTDHVFMQSVGVPGFQFIQDPLDYFPRLHHTNIDTFDHLRPADLRQASVVMAGVLWAAANDKDTLARQPLPREPKATDPFAYNEPD
ncbi:M20/M25/M40 family metallo-hydrolase [Parasphingorhabdus sp. DH2-15]|uniref:M20/M25/M40 family metallo-hydrolase n=1 Tax=Parasphingorhabdus sp. DH2-15 TaxID=3444112 RepID=UPI003F68418C